MEFPIDPKLAADSAAVGSMALCHARLMNDRRWPWLVLVPKLTTATELHDLAQDDLATIAGETARAARALAAITGCEKINSGALGNIVRQLHIHIVARNAGDPNWPGPVWGFGSAEHYQRAEMADMIKRLKHELERSGRFDAD